MKRLLNIYTFSLLVFLYLPISVLTIFSFNQSKISSVWTGFSFHWYEQLLQNEQMISSLKLSLTIGVLSSVIATIIGTLAAYALYKVNAKRRQLFQTVFDLPIVTPDLVLGIGLLIFYRTIHFETGLASVILAHITFNIPFAILIVSTRFKFIDDNLENAAIDLGASQTKAFFNVTVPMIKPGIFAAMLICFTLSWDDFIIAFFTSGVGVNTLPVKVYSMMKVGLNPQINAICVLLIAVSILVLLISLIFEKPTDYLKT